jgi:hypothetical protein
MSDTRRKYKDQTGLPDHSKKKAKDKKFFGHTSGSHSKGVVERVIDEDGKISYRESDRSPIKGEDFVKYGWPLDLRGKKAIEIKRQENDK